MSCRALRRRLLAAGAGLLLLAGPARASQVDSRAPGDPPAKRLDLKPCDPPRGTREGAAPGGLRFEDRVDVNAPPLLTPEASMALWWKRFDVGAPAACGRACDLRPDAEPKAVNLVRVSQKLYDKLGERR